MSRMNDVFTNLGEIDISTTVVSMIVKPRLGPSRRRSIPSPSHSLMPSAARGGKQIFRIVVGSESKGFDLANFAAQNGNEGVLIATTYVGDGGTSTTGRQ
eukprot:scaffold1924_cov197-Alexandrium_tamarense.AAC.2